VRVSVDYARCEGHGLCEEIAPELFQLDDDGELTMAREGQELEAGLVGKVSQAINSCPASALLRLE
jgi:ferredoxin